mmetsp:Transcript_86423/g.241913  ORF Transcript_86423/g.241913 Transcript_86423/m.241913 type:complete len:202 (-) Transcript_86423:1032-1637(-)
MLQPVPSDAAPRVCEVHPCDVARDRRRPLRVLGAPPRPDVLPKDPRLAERHREASAAAPPEPLPHRCRSAPLQLGVHDTPLEVRRREQIVHRQAKGLAEHTCCWQAQQRLAAQHSKGGQAHDEEEVGETHARERGHAEELRVGKPPAQPIEIQVEEQPLAKAPGPRKPDAAHAAAACGGAEVHEDEDAHAEGDEAQEDCHD